jgi:hypothetical protein
MLSDEGASLIGSHQLAGQDREQIRIEEELLFTEREVVDRAQQWSIEEDAAAESKHKPA